MSPAGSSVFDFALWVSMFASRCSLPMIGSPLCYYFRRSKRYYVLNEAELSHSLNAMSRLWTTVVLQRLLYCSEALDDVAKRVFVSAPHQL